MRKVECIRTDIKRLCEHLEEGGDGCTFDICGLVKETEEALNKLAEYEDLEEQGRLIKLPCKVGDTYTGICQEMVLSKKRWKTKRWLENGTIEEIHIIARLSTKKAGYAHSRDTDELKEYWFIGENQQEEAEARLKELKESEQG